MANALRDPNPLAAIDPRQNAVVHAAAGTGKTWLLVSRAIRVLLEGATPSSILAITFTRKAAAEMRLRLNQRLLSMSEASDPLLASMLQEVGLTADSETIRRARRLYEELLTAPYDLRATTFHAFCQELLSRFAFEAGVPPAFEVMELTAELEAAALRLLDRDLADNEPLGAVMERLLRHTGGLDGTRRALDEFLAHRSDWWAYTENETDPISYAARRLQDTLRIDPRENPVDAFAHDPVTRALVQSMIVALGRDTSSGLQAMSVCLRTSTDTTTAADFYRLIREALLTKAGTPRVFRVPNALARALGPAASAALVRDREALLDRLQQADERCKRLETWRRTCDWYVVGARYLEHFQRAKRTEGVLDFADLEWLAYRLLNQGRHAEWVQYKFDQRIDHLLVDEFQDTNPTQWRLLLPLLEEMAAGSTDRRRSVFLVGDEKQSIYRFRRADPALFTIARGWLATHTGARTYDQHVSWRSSPAIVRFVNVLFDMPPTAAATGSHDHQLQNFRTHETYRQELWGHAELLPLITHDLPSAAARDFRNPLEQPRVSEEDQRHRREGDMVATQIRSLLGRPIHGADGIRPLGYGDIMILLRRRMHAASYEAALCHAGIPYVGAGRGAFIKCLEVRDVMDLLRLLVSPLQDVTLAAVLRSPIFSASEDDLLALADDEMAAAWYDRMIARHGGGDSALARAARLLQGWRNVADRVPVHDLLDRIYFEANVPQRYQSAAPAHLRQRVAANLTRLLDLALEADGGRFPSLARFLARLDVLTEQDTESLDAGALAAGDQVRLLTIHAAKGLESPAVFLVDAARDTEGPPQGIDALVDWPIDQPRPESFLLLARKNGADACSRELAERRSRAAFQEESNLLYVALTRARQWLFVSGCESGRRNASTPCRMGDAARGWYGFIERRFDAARTSGAAAAFELKLRALAPLSGDVSVNLVGFIDCGSPPNLAPASSEPPTAVVVDQNLTRPFDRPVNTRPPDQDDAADGAPTDVGLLPPTKQRGVVIHRMIERLVSDSDRDRAKQRLWREFAANVEGDWLLGCWREACAVVDTPEFRRFFDPHLYDDARNEVSILYRADGRESVGVVDRLIFRGDRLVLIDYKTHRVEPSEIPALVTLYTPQLRRYADGLRRLWPARPVEAVLLFTACRVSVEVGIDHAAA